MCNSLTIKYVTTHQSCSKVKRLYKFGGVSHGWFTVVDEVHVQSAHGYKCSQTARLAEQLVKSHSLQQSITEFISFFPAAQLKSIPVL